MTGMTPRERIDYSAIDDRPPMKLPGGARLVLWTVFALEEWDISRAMARQVLPPPQGQTMIPDVPNWTWHEYGMRVGFWRLKKVFERHNINPTMTINAKACLNYPRVMAACKENGWEFNAHAYEQLPMHKLDDQRASIQKTVEILTETAGKPPRGWFGPGLTETHDTLDYLSEAGIEYIGDWVLDDEPVTVRTAHKPIVALPYNFEVHDIALMAVQHHTSDIFLKRAIDTFDTLYAESAERAKVMAIAVHPYLSGSPHRIRYIEEAVAHIMSKPGVVSWNGEQILDWYLKERPTA